MAERFYFLETVDPGNPLSDKITVRFPLSLVEYWKHNKIVQFYNIGTAKEVFDRPRRIFYGTRALSEGWWCYVGKPDKWYVGDGDTATFPKDKVFAVLLNVEFEVYGFRSEPSAEDDSLCPKDWKDRYGRLVWKN